MAPDPQLDPALAAQLNPWAWVPPEWDQPAAPPVDIVPVPEAPAPLTDAAVLPQPIVDVAPAIPLPPEPGPDAITAAAPLPTVQDLSGFNVGLEPPPTAADEILADPLAMRDNGPLAPTPAFSDEQVNQAVDKIALTGGPRLEQMAVDREVARRAKLAADTARIETENLRQTQLNADAHRAAIAAAQEKSDAITADAIALSNRTTDPDRLVNRMTGGQTVAQLIALATGGLLAGRTGGPNVAMDLLQRRIDRDIDAQKADIENAKFGIQVRRSAVAEEYARHGDLFRAGETVRLATYQSALNVMAAEQQNFDPRGFQAIERGRVMQRWAAGMAQASEAVRKQAFEENLKVIKADQEEREQQRKAAETAATIAKTKAETAKLYADATAVRSDKQQWTPEQLAVLNPGQLVPKIPMTQTAYKEWLQTQRIGEEQKTAARANDPHELAIKGSVPGVTDDKGDLVKFTDEDRPKVAEAKETTDEIVRLTDELIRMIDKDGWSSDFVKSEEWRKAKANYNEILIRKKEQDKLGVLTGPDVGIVTKEIGTEDPTELRGGVVAALKHFRHNQVEGFNAKLRNKAIPQPGRTLKRWEPPAPPAPAAETEADKALKAVLGEAKDVKPSAFTPDDKVRPVGGEAPAIDVRAAASSPSGFAQQKGLAYQLEIVEGWAAQITSEDPAVRAVALSNLGKAAGDDQNQTGAKEKPVRDRARQILTNLAGAGIQGSPEEVR